MRISKLLFSCLLFLHILLAVPALITGQEKSKLFRECMGAEFNQVRFSDVPIDPSVDTHFTLAFAIDYNSAESNPKPTNCDFNVFWDADNLSPTAVSAIKAKHPNAKVALSLGGDTVANADAVFAPSSVSS